MMSNCILLSIKALVACLAEDKFDYACFSIHVMERTGFQLNA